jgi:hypothetical protein
MFSPEISDLLKALEKLVGKELPRAKAELTQRIEELTGLPAEQAYALWVQEQPLPFYTERKGAVKVRPRTLAEVSLPPVSNQSIRRY